MKNVGLNFNTTMNCGAGLIGIKDLRSFENFVSQANKMSANSRHEAGASRLHWDEAWTLRLTLGNKRSQQSTELFAGMNTFKTSEVLKTSEVRKTRCHL